MSITRAQQARQMYKKGTFGGAGRSSRGRQDAQSQYGGGSYDSSANRSTRGQDRPNMRDIAGPIAPITNPVFGDPDPNIGSPVDTGTSFLKNLNAERRSNPFLTGAALINPIFGIPTLLRIAKQTGDMRNALGMQSPRTFDANRFSGGGDDSQAMVDIPTWMRLGFSSEAEYLASLEDEEDEKEDESLRLAFRADGGRIGLQEGGGIEQRLEQLGGDVSSAEQMLQGINQRLKTAESSLGSGGGASMQLPGVGPSVANITVPPPPPGTTFTPLPEAGGIGGGLGTLLPGVPTGLNRVPEGNMPKDTSAFKNIFMGNMNYMGGPSDKLIPIDPYKNTQLAGLSQDGQRFDSAQSAFDALAEQTRKQREITPFTRNVIGTELFQGAEGFKRFTDMFNEINDPNFVAPSPQLLSAQGSSGIPALGFAEGGNVVGGEYDFESARQMYGLGKLVKKVTRTVKKIAKSPIGKAAITAASLYYMPKFGIKDQGGLPAFLQSAKIGAQNLFLGTPIAGDVTGTRSGGLFSKIGPLGAIAGVSALAGLLTAKQEEEAQELSRGEGIDIDAARRSILARAQGNIPGDLRATAFLAEGGKPEPVAKKTMPLLDMGGKEMDLRDNGGFVPIGRMEKADDVPARLSKNEFVFTADAVRNAGDGDVDKGAEVMYNMMKNLEAGGEVSEESQGLEGARKMFQTSQRLEEVL